MTHNFFNLLNFRNCGRIFCGACSSQSLTIPEVRNTEIITNPNFKTWRPYFLFLAWIWEARARLRPLLFLSGRSSRSANRRWRFTRWWSHFIYKRISTSRTVRTIWLDTIDECAHQFHRRWKRRCSRMLSTI